MISVFAGSLRNREKSTSNVSFKVTNMKLGKSVVVGDYFFNFRPSQCYVTHYSVIFHLIGIKKTIKISGGLVVNILLKM